MVRNLLLTPALSKEIKFSLGPSRAHERKKLALGSCALAWAVKEVPDSEAGPPDAELPRQTDIDPFAQGEARKARPRAGSLNSQCRFGGVRLHFRPIRRVGSMIDRSIRSTRSPAKRLRRWEFTLSWIGRPWVLRSSHRGRRTPTDKCHTVVSGGVSQVQSSRRRTRQVRAQANSPLESAESESAG